MIDLQKISGLPIALDERNNELKFDGDFPFIKKSERSLEELKPYLRNPNTSEGSDPVYKVWRHAYLSQDSGKIKAANLRYDLTLIPPGKIDGEFSKTAGHFHLSKVGTNLPYPEIYEVLFGRAYFLTQSPGKDYNNIKGVRLIEAGPGEKVLVTPEFSGHTTINVFDEPLLMANWISDSAVYDYESYKATHGASYYFLADNDMVDIIKNPNYESMAELEKIRTKEWPQFGLLKNQPLYTLVNNLDKLRVLNYPEEFAALEW